jgi:hypothetical protein
LQEDYSFTLQQADNPVIELMRCAPNSCRLFVQDAEVSRVQWALSASDASSPKQFLAFHLQVCMSATVHAYILQHSHIPIDTLN